MKISNFIKVNQAFVQQNIASAYFTETEYASKIYEWLVDIYSRLSNTGVWFYNAIEEIISAETTVWEWDYRTTYTVVRTYRPTTKEWIETDEWFVHNSSQYKFSPFFRNENEQSYTYLIWSPSEEWTIVWYKAKSWLTNIKTRYFRWPWKIDTSAMNTQDLDLPPELVWALHHYIYSAVLPNTYLESGASLSNFYFGRYIDNLNTYSMTLWTNIKQSFIYGK